MEAQNQNMEQFFAERGQAQTFNPSVNAPRPDAGAVAEAPTYTAEVQQNEAEGAPADGQPAADADAE